MRERFTLSVSVFVIVRSGKHVLLLRRANTGWKDGFISLPAGAHDGTETLAAAAARELEEETSLRADQQDMRLVHLLHCNAGDSGGEWLGVFFQAQRWRGEPTLLACVLIAHGHHSKQRLEAVHHHVVESLAVIVGLA